MTRALTIAALVSVLLATPALRADQRTDDVAAVRLAVDRFVVV